MPQLQNESASHVIQSDSFSQTCLDTGFHSLHDSDNRFVFVSCVDRGMCITPYPTLRAVRTHIQVGKTPDCQAAGLSVKAGGWFGREGSLAGDKAHRFHGGRYRRNWASTGSATPTP